jgi:hypothetical protein
MSRGQRIGLIALAVAVAAVAFVLARPDDEEEPQQRPAAESTPRGRADGPTATIEPRPEQRIELKGHEAVGGARRIVVKKGDFVRLVVESDAPDRIHLHGYDMTRPARPAEPARFALRVEIEGIFEVESHEAEDQGHNPVIARLVVQPS